MQPDINSPIFKVLCNICMVCPKFAFATIKHENNAYSASDPMGSPSISQTREGRTLAGHCSSVQVSCCQEQNPLDAMGDTHLVIESLDDA